METTLSTNCARCTRPEGTKRVISQLPGSDRIILEVGTPLIKRYGTRVIGELRQAAKDKFIIADLKTLDVGKVEADIAYEDTADAVVAAGLAPAETLDATVQEARRREFMPLSIC